MLFFGLIDVLRAYCTLNNITFIYGQENYANALADQTTYTANAKLLIADFEVNPIYSNGKLTSVTYTGAMALGQKRETLTESSLDETPIQKYDRRLAGLTTSLNIIIQSIACSNDLDVTGAKIRFDLNQFDLNADFVACTLSFVQ